MTATKPTDGSGPSTSADGTDATEPTDIPSTVSPAPTPTPVRTPSDTDFAPDSLRISELMASNTLGILDENGKRSDWIEITNYGDVAISLDGFTLTVSAEADGATAADSTAWTFPTGVQIGPHASLLLYADGTSTGLHTSFSLRKKGRTLSLRRFDGTVIDAVTYPELEDDYVYARTGTNVSDPFIVTNIASPGYPNDLAGVDAYQKAQDTAAGKGPVINEVVTSNFQHLPHHDAYYDWIEIKNTAGTPIDLQGYYLSDNDKKPQKWPLPRKTLQPGEICVFLASGDERLSDSQYTHTNFKLDGISECLYLFDAAGNVVDGVLLTDIPYGGSMGRKPDGYGFYYFTDPTPGTENGTDGRRAIAATPIARTPGGVYTTATVTVELDGEGTIYYTTDGSEPGSANPASTVYTGPFTLAQTTVVRAVSVTPDKLQSHILSTTYLIQEGHTLPILSVSLDPDDLWSDESGIYAMGPDANPEAPYLGANFYKNWERKANATFYDVRNGVFTEGFSVDCGLKIAGSGSRELEKKSFALKFKSRYGTDTLEYPIFEAADAPTSFHSLMIRCGEDYPRSIFRDEFLTSLANDGMPNLEIQHYRFCILYLNGEYWGIYAIREKVDEDYIASRHPDADPDLVDLLRFGDDVEAGSAQDYYALCEYVRTHDMSLAESYQYLQARIDVESLACWLIAEAYYNNHDIPNMRFYQVTDADGNQTVKWRYILYDLDWGFVHHDHPFYFLEQYDMDSACAVLFHALLQNADFRDYFLTQLAYHLTTTFSEEKALQKIAMLEALIEPEVERNCTRWNVSLNYYRVCVDSMRTYATSGRAREVANAAIAYFGLSAADAEWYFGEILA